MNNMTPFRLIVTLFFGALLLGGVIAFSTYRGSNASDEIGVVNIWGTFDRQIFNDYIDDTTIRNPELRQVKYREFNDATFDRDVLEALASGESPDLLFIDDGKLMQYLNKILVLGPDNYPAQQFQDEYVELAEIYFQEGGIVGIPLVADPLVMFWNRDVFSSEGLARPPNAWPDFFNLAKTLTIVDENLNIKRSAIAFGETRNIDNLREIFSTLLFQIGNPITQYDEGGTIEATLEGGGAIESAFPVLKFYTEFSDASKSVYSWNRSLPRSEESFLSGKLAVYFGLASEIKPLRLKNPNLNFAVAEVPAVDDNVSRRKAVYAKLYGFVIPKASSNPGGAFAAAKILTGPESMRFFSNATNLAPTRRDLTSEPSADAFMDVLKKQVIYARTFLDPNPVRTSALLANMIEYVTSGQRSVDDSIYVSNAELNDLLDE